jgi:hypothetical protein
MQQNGSNAQQISSNAQQNSSNAQQNSSNAQQNSSNDIVDTSSHHECKKCFKVFGKGWILSRHEKICTGIKDDLQCDYCHKYFQHTKSKYKHYRVCKEKKEVDSKALVPIATASEPTETNITNIIDTQIHTQNVENQNIHNTQNIQNNNTQNNNIIIVYDRENIEFVKDHINNDTFRRILQSTRPHNDRRLVAEFTKELLSLPENQCVKKEDMKSGHSEVHKGGDRWELEMDHNIYPQLACNMANNVSDILHSKRNQLRNDFERIIKIVDYMTDGGYINTEDKEKEKQILKEYKSFVKELKLIVYSTTQKNKKKKSIKGDTI